MDYNATAPLEDAVITFVTDVMKETGNASSVHSFGRAALLHLEKARQHIADLCGTHPNYVTFTSGATEANNAVLDAFRDDKICISSIEHPSVLQACRAEKGLIPVDANGVVCLDALEKILQDDAPDLISVMLVNNETGVIQPVKEIVRLVRRLRPQAYVHADAAQAAGRIPIDFADLQVDYLTLSSHKFGGPQGVGALIKAPGARDAKLLFGGGQEKRQRAGTENIAGIAGMGLAAELAAQNLDRFAAIATIRDKIETVLADTAPELIIYGKNANRVANTTSLCLPGIGSETQLMAMDLAGIAVSNGSACSSGKVQKSHVLSAMGAPDHCASATLRVSLGPKNTENDADLFIDAWTKMYQRVKNKIAAA